MTRAVHMAAGEGPTIEGPAGGPLTFKVRGEQTGGSLMALENVIAPGDGPPLHVHANEDESWYVIEGDLLVLFTPSGMEAFFDRFAELPAATPEGFREIGAGVDMDVVGPPLAQSHPA